LSGQGASVRVLIVKLSSLGDVVHTMPAVHDIRRAFPDARIDWVVEPAFAPLVRRVEGIGEVIECPIRRWSQAWWTGAVRAEWRAFKQRLRSVHYDAVIDMQGLTKSAWVARTADGKSHGLANRTDGSSFEWPAAWLVDHTIKVEPRIHAMDRARVLAAEALGHKLEGMPRFALRATRSAAHADKPTAVLVHGTSRDDKLWPQAHWVALGKRLIEAGWRIALPQGNEAEQTRAELIGAALQFDRLNVVDVWPTMKLDAIVDRLAGTQGVIGVDSGLSHIAVALDLPHVQIYNFPTAWRTGPQAAHGHRHQVCVVAQGGPGHAVPGLDSVWSAWNRVIGASGG
jgi:heptosyltransferase I